MDSLEHPPHESDSEDALTTLRAKPALLNFFKENLATINSSIAERFVLGIDAAELIQERAEQVDRVITKVWELFFSDQETAAQLIAVGGYGRAELHPQSDIDLLILIAEWPDAAITTKIEHLITFLWDIGLEIGHSVRTLEECRAIAKSDLTVITSLMEARLIAGCPKAFKKLKHAISPAEMWPSRDYFIAKSAEQTARHIKYDDNAYMLEPNIKEGIGGLRDVQTILWIARRHFQAENLQQMLTQGWLLESEYDDLIAERNHLWKVRFALHLIARRHEENLLFDYQKEVAQLLGYKDDAHSLGVEKMMKAYFRTIKDLTRLNKMLMQFFLKEIVLIQDDTAPEILNSRFQMSQGYIDARHPQLFKRQPHAMLEVFLLKGERSDITEISSSTIRQIRANLGQIDSAFRHDPRAQRLFMKIIGLPDGGSSELKEMHNYGILSRYIPAFGEIEGQMQYDLFHTLTVDSHTLTLIKKLHIFTLPSDHPSIYRTVSRRLPKPELLFLAGLFHDVGKGRQGDHSELGAVDAYQFCIQHQLSEHDAQLVTWLVRNHLLMSDTAQRRDISSPDIINQFCQWVGHQSRLDYLYLLTVADIQATNPKLWNGWKASLLLQLFKSAESQFNRGLHAPFQESELIEDVKSTARKLLADRKVHHMRTRSFWKALPRDYFIRFSPEEIAWHTEALTHDSPHDLPVVLIKGRSHRGGTELFIYEQDRPNLFALMCLALDSLKLSILDARILTSHNNMTLDSYLVVEADGVPVSDPDREKEIAARLRSYLLDPASVPKLASRRVARRLKHFYTPTEVLFRQDPSKLFTLLEISASDRPGLLAHIGRAFVACGLRVENARISTYGERAEDIFSVTNSDRQPITQPEEQEAIRDAILRQVNQLNC